MGIGVFDLTYDVVIYDDNDNILYRHQDEKFRFTNSY